MYLNKNMVSFDILALKSTYIIANKAKLFSNIVDLLLLTDNFILYSIFNSEKHVHAWILDRVLKNICMRQNIWHVELQNCKLWLDCLLFPTCLFFSNNCFPFWLVSIQKSKFLVFWPGGCYGLRFKRH